MSDLIVIGISGVARSGKDTVANHLVHSAGFTRIALADGIRESFAGLNGQTWELSKDLENAQKTTRWALQTMGTESRSGLDDSLYHTWINLAFIKIRYLHRYHPRYRHRFVIPDVRFAHESERLGKMIRSVGGRFECWKIERPGAGLTGEAANHASETSVANVQCEATFVNNLDIGHLLGCVDHAIDLMPLNQPLGIYP